MGVSHGRQYAPWSERRAPLSRVVEGVARFSGSQPKQVASRAHLATMLVEQREKRAACFVHRIIPHDEPRARGSWRRETLSRCALCKCTSLVFDIGKMSMAPTRSHGVSVSTLDSASTDRGANPRETFFSLVLPRRFTKQHKVVPRRACALGKIHVRRAPAAPPTPPLP